MAAAGTAEFWKHWEGRQAGEGLTLGQCLGGGASSAVFEATAQGDSGKCVIRLVRANPSTAELQLSRWQRAARLSHPNLMKLLGCGRCQLDDTAMLYVVMELADEDLSQVVPERPLTAAEAREMLGPVLSALRHVHRQGFIHGHLKPSNIMAAGDQVKISSDGLSRAGEMGERRAAPGRYDAPETVTSGPSPAGDAWSLGVTLAEVLTQRLPDWTGPGQNELTLPEGIPDPFAEIVRHCLQRDARSRWSADQIATFLESGKAPVTAAAEPSPGPREAPPKRLIALGVAALALVALLFLWNRTTPSNTPAPKSPVTQTQSVPAPQTAPVASAPAPAAAVEKTEPRPKRTAQEKDSPQTPPASGDIMVQVMPKVTQHSLDAIHGRFAVVIRAQVDGQGNVTAAEFETRGPSRFFAEKSAAAARQWHFKPSEGAQEWLLRFDYSKGMVEVAPTRSAK